MEKKGWIIGDIERTDTRSTNQITYYSIVWREDSMHNVYDSSDIEEGNLIVVTEETTSTKDYKIGDVCILKSTDLKNALARGAIWTVILIEENGVTFTFNKNNKTQAIPFEFCDVAFRKLTDTERILFTNGKI